MTKTPTTWSPPTGKGYVNSSSGAALTDQSGVILTSQSGVQLIINEDIYHTEFLTSWTLSTKGKSSWLPSSGQGTVVNVGAENFTTNSGLFITDNLGNQLVTTPTYDKSKNATAWTQS